MKKLIYVFSGIALAALIISFSLPADVANKIAGAFTACSMNKSRADEITVTGKLVSAKEWMAGKAGCAECNMSATATSGKAPESAGTCPSIKGDKAGEAMAAEESGDCCSGGEARKTASTEYGIVDAEGNFFLALATENVCNESLGSHRNRTVRLNGTRTELNGMPAIAGAAIEEIR